jgi:hypothetical protein
MINNLYRIRLRSRQPTGSTVGQSSGVLSEDKQEERNYLIKVD